MINPIDEAAENTTVFSLSANDPSSIEISKVDTGILILKRKTE
jgi:hypothetical protein